MVGNIKIQLSFRIIKSELFQFCKITTNHPKFIQNLKLILNALHSAAERDLTFEVMKTISMATGCNSIC